MSLPEGLKEYPHRRLNPLTREWVLVSPHRAKRPWLGQMEKTAPAVSESYVADCYLCPGNERAGGKSNPSYPATFVFENDFAALLSEAPPLQVNDGGLLVAEGERGICRVMCFSPDHNLSISRLSATALTEVVRVWGEQSRELGAIDWVRSVQIFENRGEMMGASNPHPHCQIWANRTVPGELAKEVAAQEAFENGCLLCQYVEMERRLGARVVLENDFWLVVVPFWAVWPFETLLISMSHVRGMDELDARQQTALAEVLRRLATRYDNLFETPFPYTMGFHQRPVDGGEYEKFHLHAHFYPPLLRSATVRKFMVGYEMLGNPQRDITAEHAAERLRGLSEQHYLDS